jgi:hypothetical protein
MTRAHWPGVLVTVAIVRLPANGGHIPLEGIKAGMAKPAGLPSILPAALVGQNGQP